MYLAIGKNKEDSFVAFGKFESGRKCVHSKSSLNYTKHQPKCVYCEVCITSNKQLMLLVMAFKDITTIVPP